MYALELDNISKAYGAQAVLTAIDLQVTQGDFVVIVGPSGCGKSTLLRIIAGLEDHSGGHLRIDGALMDTVPPSKRGIGMVFQSYALYPHLNVANNMGLALRRAGLARADIGRRIDDAAAMLGLQALLRRRPAQLSGGQRQRVAIGRAIVRQPKLFLFDEPLSNLDAELRVNTRLEIAQLHRALGATMVYVTHDQTEAMTLADRIVVMRAGRIEQSGSPRQLYEDPVNLFVAGFIGSPRMNLIGGAIAAAAGAATLGIRPEHLAIDAATPRWRGVVRHIEYLGSDSFVFVRIDPAIELCVRMTGGGLARAIGETIGLSPLPGQLLYFDAAGARLHDQDQQRASHEG